MVKFFVSCGQISKMHSVCLKLVAKQHCSTFWHFHRNNCKNEWWPPQKRHPSALYQRTMIRANSIEGIREQQIVLFVEFEITTLIWLSEVITWIAHIWETTKAITHKQGCLGMRDPPILQIPNFCNFWYFSNLCLFWNETFISAILEDKHEMLSRAYWLHWVL